MCNNKYNKINKSQLLLILYWCTYQGLMSTTHYNCIHCDWLLRPNKIQKINKKKHYGTCVFPFRHNIFYPHINTEYQLFTRIKKLKAKYIFKFFCQVNLFFLSIYSISVQINSNKWNKTFKSRLWWHSITDAYYWNKDENPYAHLPLL